MTKICRKCNRELGVEAFARNSKSADGLLGRCRDCSARWRLAKESGAYHAPTKVCSACKVEKKKSEFCRCPTAPDGLQYRCKECNNALNRKIRAERREEKEAAKEEARLAAIRPGQLNLNGGRVAIVDLDVWEWARAHDWLYYDKNREGSGSVFRREILPSGEIEIVRLHNKILGLPKRAFVTHKDGDKLNNLRSNLYAPRLIDGIYSKSVFYSNDPIKPGDRFGRLEVIGDSGDRVRGRVFWLCRCDCGKQVYIRGSSLKSGSTKSCGCLSSDIRKEQTANRKPREERRRTAAATKRATKRKLRNKILSYYSDGLLICDCPGCGCSDPEFLVLDHKFGNGNKHRKEVGPSKMLQWIVKNNYPSIFRVLCHNCNQATSGGGECPHEYWTRIVDDVWEKEGIENGEQSDPGCAANGDCQRADGACG